MERAAGIGLRRTQAARDGLDKCGRREEAAAGAAHVVRDRMFRRTRPVFRETGRIVASAV